MIQMNHFQIPHSDQTNLRISSSKPNLNDKITSVKPKANQIKTLQNNLTTEL